jgi:hypothetical protein
MPKGSGRTTRATPETEFGQRLEAEFVALGYHAMADRARALSGFNRALGYLGRVEPQHIRQWLAGVEPRLGAVKVLEAIGVDMHYCLTGTRSAVLAITPADGFDMQAFASRMIAAVPHVRLPIRWTAAETLRTVRFRDKASNSNTTGELYAAFEDVLRLRARTGRCNPVRSVPPRLPAGEEWLSNSDVVTVMAWFELWCHDFGIVINAPPVDRMIAHSPELQSAIPKVGRAAVEALCHSVWEEQRARDIRAVAMRLGMSPPFVESAAAA